MSDDKQDLEAVLRRVQKLLAIANDDRANPAEAAAAASQAEKIMRRYQIDHAGVIEAQLKKADSFGFESVGGTMNPEARASSTCTWSGMLCLAIARLNDCKAEWTYSHQLGVHIRYSGFKSDAQICLWTHLYVVNQLGMALARFKREAHGSVGRKEAEQFRLGFVCAVVESINAEIERKRAEMQSTSASRALVVSKANAVAERFGQQQTRDSKTRVGHGRDEGYAEGRKVDINRRAVGGTTTSQALLA
jgi:hypothetical protein